MRRDTYRGRLVEWVSRPPRVLTVAGAVLVPWSVALAHGLPSVYQARHWSLAWGGLDCAIAAAALTTAWLYRVGDRRAAAAAVATATMVAGDAWFDVLTSAPGGPLAQALACGVVEVAFAAYCTATAHEVIVRVGGVRTTVAGDNHLLRLRSPDALARTITQWGERRVRDLGL